MKTTGSTLLRLSTVTLVALASRTTAQLNTGTWDKGEDGNWTATVVQFPSANEDWDVDDTLGAGFPHNYSPLGDFYEAEIGEGYTVTVLPFIPIAISKLTLTEGAAVALVDGAGFYLQRTGADAGVVDSDGTVSLTNAAGVLATNLYLDGTITFTGGGKITMGGSGTAISGTHAFNLSSRMDLEDHTVEGAGELGAEALSLRLLANGIIRANVPLQRLDIKPGPNNNIVNAGLIEATDGGALRLWQTAVNNDGGAIRAGSGSLVELHQVTLFNGELAGEGVVRGLTTVTLEGHVTNSGTYAVASGAATLLDGELTNTGQIVIGGGSLLMATPAEVNGAGEIILGVVPGGTSTLGAVFNSGATLLNTNNLIRGGGNLSVAMTNQFTVRADEITAPLRIQRHCTNQHRLEARAGATLMIADGSTTTNHAAAVISAVNGTVLAGSGGNIVGGRVTIDGSSRLEIANGSVTGGEVIVSPGGVIAATQFHTNRLSGVVQVPGSARLEIDDDDGLILDGAGTYQIGGTLRLNGAGEYASFAATRLYIDGPFTLQGGGSLLMTNSSSNVIQSYTNPLDTFTIEDVTIKGSGQLGRNTLTIINRDSIEADHEPSAEPGSGVLEINPGAGGFTNEGRLLADNGTLMLWDGEYRNAAGSIASASFAKVDLRAAANIIGGRLHTSGGKFRVLADTLYDGVTSGALEHDALSEITGTLRLTGSIVNRQRMRVEAGAFLRIDGPVTLTGGGLIEIPWATSRISNYAGALPGDTLINMDNTIRGDGTIQFIALDNHGTIEPGNSPGRLFTGNVTQRATAAINIEIAGSAAGQFDVLDVQGTIALAGKLKVVLLPGLNVPAGTTFNVITSGGMTGSFSTLDLPRNGSGQPLFSVAQTGNTIRLTALEPVTGPVPVPYSAWAANEGLTPANNATGADPNGDGLPNIAAYFLGLPALGGNRGAGLTVTPRPGGGFTVTFTSPRTVTGVTAGTEISTSMAGGTWTPGPVPSVVNTTATHHEYAFIVFTEDEMRQFARLIFTTAP